MLTGVSWTKGKPKAVANIKEREGLTELENRRDRDVMLCKSEKQKTGQTLIAVDSSPQKLLIFLLTSISMRPSPVEKEGSSNSPSSSMIWSFCELLNRSESSATLSVNRLFIIPP